MSKEAKYMQDYIDTGIKSGSITVVSREQQNVAQSYLKQAYTYAKKYSDDDSTWTGAVAVQDNEVISMGANRFSVGVEKSPSRLIKPLKYQVLDHAERQCIYNAAKKGIKLENAIMYTPLVPCSPCANGIISTGFSELVLHYDKTIKIPNDWFESVSEAIKILFEAGVIISVYKGEVGGVTNLLRGDTWNP